MTKQTLLVTVASAATLFAACGGSSNDGGSSGGGSGGSSSGTGGAVGAGGKSGKGGSDTSGSGGALGKGGAEATGGTVGGGGSGPGTGGESAGGTIGSGGSEAGGGTIGSGGAMGAGGTSGGGTSIAGTVMGKPFNKAAVAYWIGKADPDPNGLDVHVIYVFESAFPCAKISKVGWDAPGNLGNLQVLELRALGPTPGTFKVVGPPPPTAMATASGEVAVNQVDNTREAAPEQIFNGGTVTIDKTTPNMSATGSFDVKFSMGSLKGTFDATYCATGVEP